MSSSEIQPDLVKLQSKLTDEIEKDEKIRELAAKRIEKNRALLHAINGSLGAMLAQETGYSKMSDTIRAAIKALPSPRFTAPDVERSLMQHFPTVLIEGETVRSTLWNMKQRGEIICTRKGNNQLPAEYERTADGGHLSPDTPSGGRIRRRGRPALRPVSDANDLLPTNGAAG